jgi:predicted double-glycine peptidase
MNPMFWPTLVMASALFWLGQKVARKSLPCSTTVVMLALGLLASVPGIVFAIYYLKVLGEPLWFYQFRALPFTELTASGAGFLAGYLHGKYAHRPKFARVAGKAFFPGVLLLGLSIPYLKPVVNRPDWNSFQEKWSDNVCLQSTGSSCGPSCLATLLRLHGENRTEKQIAQEAFTSGTGTENWYLARVARKHGRRIRFIKEAADSDLFHFPAIAGVRLLKGEASGHFITILGREGDKYVIGDPLEGRTKLDLKELKEAYAFTGFFMIVE